MNDSDSPLKHNPFATLGELLKDKAVLRPVPIKKPAVPLIKPGVDTKKSDVSTENRGVATKERVASTKKTDVDTTGVDTKKSDVDTKTQGTEPAEACAQSVNEESAFQEAMQDVKPVEKDKHHAKEKNVANPLDHLINEPEQDVIEHLDKLVKYGEGFVISKTPEYLEGTGRDIPPEFAERLHRGDFSIQAHIDLHGMGAAQAKDAFENFLNEAIMSGKRAVLIIHGRGISSPGEPVLKNKVSEWLERSHWRKWVIAFTSAQSYDGGAGATYVLLRHRLTSKQPREKEKGK